MMKSPKQLRLWRLTAEGSWVVSGQFMAMIGAVVLVRILTEYLSPTQYGHLALGLTVAALVNQVVMGAATAGITRFYAIAVERDDLAGYLRGAQHLMAWSALVVLALGVFLIGGLALTGLEAWIGLAGAALVLSLLSGCNSALNGLQSAARRRPIVAFHQGLDSWLKIALALGMILWLGASSTTVVIGYAISALIVLVSQLVFLGRTTPRRATRSAEVRPWLKDIWLYCWPFSAWGVFTWMQQVSDRWSLEAFATTGDVGLYAVVYQLGFAPVSIALSMAMAFFGPILFQRAGDASDPGRSRSAHRLMWQTAVSALMITSVGVVVTTVFHDGIFRLLTGPAYREASYLLPWMVLASGIFAAGQMISLKLMSNMDTRALLAPKVATALLGVVFNVIGAALAGPTGVVVALVAFSSVYAIWICALAHSHDRHQ